MRQHEAVIVALEKLGGATTLSRLYGETMKIEDCEWKTKTPFASIRRIVQQRPEIFKIKPGVWALESRRKEYEFLIKDSIEKKDSLEMEHSHSFFQGILADYGKLSGFDTFISNQDKNKKFSNRTLDDIRTLNEIPIFSYIELVNRSKTIDCIWFNEIKMPKYFF